MSPQLETFTQDLRFGFRQLRRSPAFAVVAILCLTLGIGANAAVFSWIEGILLRPFPLVKNQDRLLALAGVDRSVQKKGTGTGYTDISWPDFLDLRRNCTQVEFIADKIMGTTLSIGDKAERVTGSIVSSNYFDALGIHPILGRSFDPSEETGRNAHPVTVVSYWMWQQRFGRDPDIIGKTQTLNGVPHTIIGVTPEGFYGTFVGWPIQFWVPVSMEGTFEPEGYGLEDRSDQWVEGFVLLKPGVTSVQAQAEIAAVATRLENDFPQTNRGHGMELVPLWRAPFNHAGEMFPRLGIAMVVVFGVLLIACANVSNLLLVRAFARRQEINIRLAIGAGRARLIRQLLTEALILATFAAAGAVLVAYSCRNLMVLFFPSSNSFVTNMRGTMDWRVLALSAAVSLASTLFFGLIPALQTSNIDLAGSLKSESGAVFGGRGKARLRSTLVLVQVSLSFILLVGAVLLLESLQQIRIADPGFSTQNVLTTSVDLLSAGYDVQRAKTFQEDLVDRVHSLPSVESVALARARPFSYQPFSSATISVEGYVPALDEIPTADYNQVSPGYFATMGIPLASGRDFTANDNEAAPRVAIVNQKMAQEYWRGDDPVSKRFQIKRSQGKDEWIQVVGLAKQSKYSSFGEAPKPFFYVPLRQDFSVRTTLNIRTTLDSAAMAASLAREMHALDPNLAPSEVVTMRRFINYSALASQQIMVVLLGIFGALALLLAAIGLYGVMAYSVSQNTRELGLRMALGAGRADLLRLVMGNGLTLTACGVALGAIAALSLTRLIGYVLYNVSPRDPIAFGVAFAVMALVSIAACLLPASRAARVDPVRALRE
jgi:macrolide transport system ATP-binding/permease protein